jgi:glycosyltransferase involved in cell wall biosynthesis
MSMKSKQVEQASARPADAPASAVRTSIVLPAYNERGNLRPLVEELVAVIESEEVAAFRPVEIVVVDDGSTDGTDEILRELAAEYEQFRAVFLQRNFGQSAALCAGFDVARGEFVVTLDADGQNNPADIPDLLSELVDGYDCVSGWRRDRQDPLSKRLPSTIQTYLAMWTGPDIHDFGCTLTAYRSQALEDIQLRGENHRYIPAKLYDRGYRITEREVDHRPRDHGSTKYGAGRLLRGFVDLCYHIFWNKYSARPIHLLGGIGMILLSVGALIGTHAVAIKYLFDASLTSKLPRLILTVALVLFGFQMLMFGVLAEMLTTILYRNERPYRIERIHDGAEDGAAGQPESSTAPSVRGTEAE